jgi:tRNA threonylcarbamoyladenosine biosynthesis protein TsaE
MIGREGYNNRMAILDDQTVDSASHSPEQTQRLGVRLGELLEPGDLLCLAGDLGAGKTTLAQGIGRGWGAAGRVTSPTFTLINEYPRARDGRILYHLDAYRLDSLAEVITVGVEDLFDGRGAMMIEWPERLEAILPAERLWISLTYLDDTRRSLRLTAVGPRHAHLLKEFRRSAFGI